MKPDPERWRCVGLPSGTGYRLSLLLIVLLAVVPAVQPSASPQEDEEFDMYVSHGDPIANSLPSLPIHVSGWMRNKSAFPRTMSIYLEWRTPSGSIYNAAQNGCVCWNVHAQANAVVGPGGQNNGKWTAYGMFDAVGSPRKEEYRDGTYNYFESRYYYGGQDPATGLNIYFRDECFHECNGPPQIDFLHFMGTYLHDRGFRILGPPVECRHNFAGMEERGKCFTLW